MQKLKLAIVGSFLLFTSTGIKSNSETIGQIPLMPIKEEYNKNSFTISEFDSLHKMIEENLKLRKQLDSLKQLEYEKITSN